LQNLWCEGKLTIENSFNSNLFVTELVGEYKVVLANAFDEFLRQTDLNVEIEAALNKVNYKDVNSVDQASKMIRDLIHDAKMPKDLQKEILNAYDALSTKFEIRNKFKILNSKIQTNFLLRFGVVLRPKILRLLLGLAN